MIEVKIESIRASLMSEHRIVILKDTGSERLLPIWIGRCEAEAIAIRLQNVETPRPLTHDLLANAITEMGGEIAHITVNDLRDNTFFAQITVNQNERTVQIDSRPSDAIALAVRANASIFVEEHVMAEASIVPETDVTENVDDEELAVFRDFINSLDLDDLPVQ
ncbi:MAG: bifunctional nuclease family protein [Chloroflexi bacterium]|nr:bifunctional nuclease family protein [Chloroflexota bacterium]